jgi:hypothetical protein
MCFDAAQMQFMQDEYLRSRRRHHSKHGSSHGHHCDESESLSSAALSDVRTPACLFHSMETSKLPYHPIFSLGPTLVTFVLMAAAITMASVTQRFVDENQIGTGQVTQYIGIRCAYSAMCLIGVFLLFFLGGRMAVRRAVRQGTETHMFCD